MSQSSTENRLAVLLGCLVVGLVNLNSSSQANSLTTSNLHVVGRTLTPEQTKLWEEQEELYAKLEYDQKHLSTVDYPDLTLRLLSSIKKLEVAFGPASAEVGCALDLLSAVYDLQKKYDLQVPVARRAQSIKAKILGNQAVDTAYSTTRLAQALVNLGQPAQAASLLKEHFEQLKGLSSTRSAETMTSYELALVNVSMHNYAEAEIWFAKAMDLKLHYARHSRVYPILVRGIAVQVTNLLKLDKLQEAFSACCTASQEGAYNLEDFRTIVQSAKEVGDAFKQIGQLEMARKCYQLRHKTARPGVQVGAEQKNF